MGNLAGYNANNVDGTNNFDPVPPGDYPVQCVKTEVKRAKSGADYISMEFEVIAGQHQGRRLWDNFNLWHHNPDAKLIAERQLKSLCEAVGILTPQDSDDFLMKPVVAAVKIQPGKDGYDPSNKISAYKAANSQFSAPQAQQGAGQFQPPAQQHSAPQAQAHQPNTVQGNGMPAGPWRTPPAGNPTGDDQIPF